MLLEEEIKKEIRDIKDFPQPGIIFKDITPILLKPKLCTAITEAFAERASSLNIDAIAGIEARGFLFGMMLAEKMNVPFIPIRKSGKLPYETIYHEYDLEYGSAAIEMHVDACKPEWNVLIHDDLLATGGTAEAAATLISKEANVAGFTFLVELAFLKGAGLLKPHSDQIISLVTY